MVPAILRDPEATRKLLDAIAETPGGKRSLSRLARTCKAVSEPTLNVLWRDMHSLVPLIGLFPAHLLKKARKPSLGLVKTPSTGDWKRVLEYGERVRSITYHESANNVPPSIFTVFEEHKPQEFILPNLLRLVWRAETPDGLDRSSLFLSPELQSLDLEVGTRFPQLHLFLAEMSRRTRLTEFSFNSPTNLPDSFTELLAKQTDLQKVTLVAPGALAPGIGKWVAGLPKLRALELDLTGRSVIAVEGFFDDIRSSRSGSSTPSSDSGVFSGDEIDFSDIRKSSLRLTGDLSVARGAFRGLQGLHLTGEAGNIATFLKHLTSPLTSLELVIEDPPDKADWTDLSTMISDKFGETLRSLRLTATGSSRFSELVRSTSRLETPPKHLPLTKLAGMYRLGRLEIDLPESFIFHNADLKHLARECPNIEVLKLCPLARFTSAPFITLEGLAPLTSSCRRLHTLGIVVNADGGREEVLADRRVISRSLLRLHVGHSWISSPLQVAILLSHLAPSLETLKWFHEKNRPGFIEARAQAWQAVSDILPHLQSVRLLERRAAVEAILAAAAAAAASRSAGPAYVAPETVDKEVDATVVTSSQAVSATPLISEHSVQCSPEFVSEMIDATPLIFSVSIDATPDVADASSSASPTISEKEIDATPLTVSTEVGAVASTKSKSTETLLLSPVHGPRVEGTKWTSYMVIPSFFALILLACRVFVLYPFYIPLRIIDASLSSLHARREEPSSATKVEKRTSYSDAASLSSSDASDIPVGH
ncbi:hypothetical protein PLICRDRAFT_100523 [Plicaturopsis crispa FD-325 SS-3]|nr:hypothetical protein PLICRDRAFT_100523 [Plicaturopsis crispa FD-325 SS-3]